jgi:hypothetical protein
MVLIFIGELIFIVTNQNKYCENDTQSSLYFKLIYIQAMRLTCCLFYLTRVIGFFIGFHVDGH